ncbi:hypothetical protein E4U17_002631 [Claviceps sp. LM77 group G4]|nr:hypothetical protein E4U17_002631 [Claviceps sp. LM77 group G4]KAG6072981.1 hypothetical protein E4U33_003092 [Claviceps sp. LM78 group G4]KAG6075425.1 hypothetical protein E4U16_003369 [Claviceps sp. LM84 group G4]
MADRKNNRFESARNVLKRIRHSKNKSTEAGPSEAAAGEGIGENAVKEGQALSQGLSETETTNPLLGFVRGALQKRQQQREAAAAGGDGSNKEPLPRLSQDGCGSFFPLSCSQEAWNQLLADFPDDAAALWELGHDELGHGPFASGS